MRQAGVAPVFSSYYYDCAMLTALAAVQAHSDDPAKMKHAFAKSLQGQSDCSTFGACVALLAAGKTIHYRGASERVRRLGRPRARAGQLRRLVVRAGRLARHRAACAADPRPLTTRSPRSRHFGAPGAICRANTGLRGRECRESAAPGACTLGQVTGTGRKRNATPALTRRCAGWSALRSWRSPSWSRPASRRPTRSTRTATRPRSAPTPGARSRRPRSRRRPRARCRSPVVTWPVLALIGVGAVLAGTVHRAPLPPHRGRLAPGQPARGGRGGDVRRRFMTSRPGRSASLPGGTTGTRGGRAVALGAHPVRVAGIARRPRRSSTSRPARR